MVATRTGVFLLVINVAGAVADRALHRPWSWTWAQQSRMKDLPDRAERSLEALELQRRVLEIGSPTIVALPVRADGNLRRLAPEDPGNVVQLLQVDALPETQQMQQVAGLWSWPFFSLLQSRTQSQGMTLVVLLLITGAVILLVMSFCVYAPNRDFGGPPPAPAASAGAYSSPYARPGGNQRAPAVQFLHPDQDNSLICVSTTRNRPSLTAMSQQSLPAAHVRPGGNAVSTPSNSPMVTSRSLDQIGNHLQSAYGQTPQGYNYGYGRR